MLRASNLLNTSKQFLFNVFKLRQNNTRYRNKWIKNVKVTFLVKMYFLHKIITKPSKKSLAIFKYFQVLSGLFFPVYFSEHPGGTHVFIVQQCICIIL